MANSNKKSTSNSNVNKGMKYSTKNKVIMGSVIAVLVLVLVGYFIYISGFLARVIPAVKCEQTIDGKTKTVATICTPELNFYRNQILSMYSMYGQSIDSEFLDAYNEAKGKTNRQLIYDSAAESAMNVYLVADLAKNDPNFFSGADRYAEQDLYMYSLRAKNNKYPTVDAYLAVIYGTGMSSTEYRSIVARQEMTQEYEQYIRQFKFMPEKAELQAMYDADPDAFLRANFNSFFFSDSMYPDGEALEMANAVCKAATSSDTFNKELIEQLGVEYAYSMGLSVEGNNSLTENATKAITDGANYPEGTTEFVFNKDNVGKATVIETETGAVVIYLDELLVNDEATYSYRGIVIANEAFKNLDDGEVPTEEAINKGLANAQAKAEKLQGQVTDELSFVELCKKNTDNYEDITYGGYISGLTVSSLETENASADEIAVATWLKDPSRAHGNMIIVPAADKKSVTLYFFDDVMPAWMNTLAQQEITNKVNTWSTTEVNVQNTVPYVSYDVAEKMSYYAQ